jgi:hypothetical protein
MDDSAVADERCKILELGACIQDVQGVINF